MSFAHLHRLFKSSWRAVEGPVLVRELGYLLLGCWVVFLGPRSCSSVQLSESL